MRPKDPAAYPHGLFINCEFANGFHVIPYVRAQERLRQKGLRAENEPDLAVIICPLCGRRHLHGWGTGPRAPHCGPRRDSEYRDYYIDCDETLPVKFIRRN